ncbi:MAG: endolytic transglycosylase MltG, partial [Deltaproteobacteria bacterium]|nr:endolytic transglycosylase MltG [Deltaproteobacteria bacterium]
MTRKIFIRLGLGLVAVCVVAFFLGLSSWNKVNEPVSSNADSVVFTVASGSSMRSVAKRLEEEKLIRSAKALRLLSRVRGLDGKIRAGEYDLSAASDTSAILTLLTSGTMKTYEISIPEGLTAREISVRLEAAELCDSEAFLAYALDPESAKQLGIEGPSLEGYLFPETYRLPRGLPPERIARIFVDEFNKNWEQVVKGKSSTTLNKQELVTLASIVEKETGAAEERPTIAAVFVNRMKLGMRLETDPTVIYGISDFDGNLTRAHLR